MVDRLSSAFVDGTEVGGRRRVPGRKRLPYLIIAEYSAASPDRRISRLLISASHSGAERSGPDRSGAVSTASHVLFHRVSIRF